MVFIENGVLLVLINFQIFAHPGCKSGLAFMYLNLTLNKGVPYIENDLGQRLIYPGDTPDALLGKYAPGGLKAAVLYWKSPPPEGWEEWERANDINT